MFILDSKIAEFAQTIISFILAPFFPFLVVGAISIVLILLIGIIIIRLSKKKEKEIKNQTKIS